MKTSHLLVAAIIGTVLITATLRGQSTNTAPASETERQRTNWNVSYHLRDRPSGETNTDEAKGRWQTNAIVHTNGLGQCRTNAIK